MKQFIQIGILLFFVISCAKNTGATKAQYDAMNKESMTEFLTYISSDDMKGRDTGSDELKIVAKHISEKLNAFGYKGLGADGSFIQPVTMYKTNHKMETLELAYNGKKLKAVSMKDFVLFARKKPAINFDAPLYYVQAGIYSDDIKQFDPEKVKGAIVIRRAVTDEEKGKSSGDRTLTTELNSKYGAIAVINIISKDRENLLGLYGRFAVREGRTLDLEDKSGIQLLMKETIAKSLFKADKISKPNYNSAYEFKSNFKVAIENEILGQIETQNVVAMLKGTDEKRSSEIVAFGAHYDHTGVNADGSINNGADDDGSGTTSVFYIAKAMALNPPARSIMIIFHTGEEKGLLGSKYFADNPLVDFKDMVAMFNLDMVGRSKSDRDSIMLDPSVPITESGEIYLVGSDRISKELHTVSEQENITLGKTSFGASSTMKLNYLLNDESHSARIYYRSDHWNYAKNGVPIIFYFDGIHIDYHKATDTVEKIDFDKLQNVTHLAFATGYKVAMMKERLKID